MRTYYVPDIILGAGSPWWTRQSLLSLGVHIRMEENYLKLYLLSQIFSGIDKYYEEYKMAQ